MKDWKYYSTPVFPYCGFKEEQEYREKIIAEINDVPMTASEREAALKEVTARVRKYRQEQNKPYKEAQAKLDQEFWQDARDELGYAEFLSAEGVSAIEAKAWEDGHISGYSEVYSHLADLVDLAVILTRK